MSRWFRCYDDLVDDPKVQQLPAEIFKGLINLWCLASKNEGVLPPIADISFKLRLKADKVSKLLGALRIAGLLEDEEGVTRPHNWNARQYKSDVADPTAALRQKAYRNRIKDRNGTVTVTPPRAETEQIQNAAPAAPDPEADLFRRGKQVLGKSAGGLIKQLLDAKDGKTNLARAAIENAAGKENPREYVGKIIRNQDPPAGEVSRYVDGRL